MEDLSGMRNDVQSDNSLTPGSSPDAEELPVHSSPSTWTSAELSPCQIPSGSKSVQLQHIGNSYIHPAQLHFTSSGFPADVLTSTLSSAHEAEAAARSCQWNVRTVHSCISSLHMLLFSVLA